MSGTEIDPKTGYYSESAYSLSPLPTYLHTGLLIIGSLACLSLVTTAAVLTYIVYHYFRKNRHMEKSSSFNQCVVLVSNLLFADFLQALSFSISFHWHALDGILAPTSYCYAQAGFLHFGNLASGSFVFVIALHTAHTVLKQRSVHSKTFLRVIVSVWCAAAVFTCVGPIAIGSTFFTRAGNWCWISQKYDLARLVLHYLWIFIFQFSTILIYAGLYCYLHWWSRLAHRQSPLTSQNARLMKAARSMIVYPIIYTIGTLPIATARMLAMSGTHPSSRYLIFAGSLLTSCGWADGLLYTIMRNVFRESESDRGQTASATQTDPSNTSIGSHETTSKKSGIALWVRSRSVGSCRSPLWHVESPSTYARHSRNPSDTSTDANSTLISGDVPSRIRPSVSTRRLSFLDFLDDVGDDSGSDPRELHPIPESPVQHTDLP